MGSGKPYPISNPSKVNVRRERLNLADPIEVYAMYHGIEYRTPSKTKADQDSIQAFNMAKAKLAVFYNQINDDRAIAINNLKDAIQAFGSLSNEELFYASQTLVSTNQEEAIDLGLRILRVLVWREWPGLNVTLSSPIFKHLEDNKDWLELKEMISVLYK